PRSFRAPETCLVQAVLFLLRPVFIRAHLRLIFSRMLDIKAYLERINYRGSRAPTGETLRALQVAHLLTVPFENLSIHAGQPIVLEDAALFTKIVTNRRGGFCYEANGLFAALLRALNFDVAMLSAEVANAIGEFGPAFDHMTLMVQLERRWLVDVGFGDSFLEPLLLDERNEQRQGSRAYRIIPDGNCLVLMKRDEGEESKVQYRFTLQPYTYADYAEMCRYHQTSPESHFTRSRICSRATEEGRITMADMRLITTSNSAGSQVRHERTLASEDEYADVLREQFGIVM
ncbi:MAG TPA: arylamine N-acetyltransferase, partial [Pyrinomonadaceae bacterium]|nr:arylamine N-acetyltransferase [Pyrinomonadaceae bacterium]